MEARATLLGSCLEGLDQSAGPPEIVDAATSAFVQKAYNGLCASSARATGSLRPSELQRRRDGSKSPSLSSPRRLPNRSRRFQDRAAQCAERALHFRGKGRIAVAQSQISRCRKHAEDALIMDDLNAGARFLLVGCLLHQHEFDQAKNELRRILSDLTEEQQRFMADPIVHLVLGHISRRLGDLDGATSNLKQAVGDYPGHPQPCLALADLFCQRGRRGASSDMATLALDRDADSRCPEHLSSSEKAAALSYVHQLTEDSEDDDFLAEIGDDEDSGVRHRLTNAAAPGGMLSTIGPAIAFPNIPQEERVATGSIDTSRNRQQKEQAPPPKLRSKPFAPRKTEDGHFLGDVGLETPGRMGLSKLIGDNMRSGLLPSSASGNQGLLIQEHVPKEPDASRLGCAGLGAC